MTTFHRKLMFSVGLLAIIGLGLSFSPRAEATTYALVCNQINAQLIQEWDRDTPMVTSATFKAAAQGDNAAPVPPGTCAWRDRPLRSTEPRCIQANGLHPLYYQYRSPAWKIVGCDGSASTSLECGFYNAYYGRQVFLIGTGTGSCFTPVGTSN